MKHHIEGMYSTNESMTKFCYYRVTYQPYKKKLNLDKYSKDYKLIADAKIPITVFEIVDMRIRVTKSGIEDYTMQYRDNQKKLNIRCDNGHGQKPHIDMERPGRKKEKNFVDIHNYEDAINLVLTKAEENNPRIGAMYWLPSPIFSIIDQRVHMLEKLKISFKIETPLTILARAASVDILNEVTKRKGSVVTIDDIEKLFNKRCKEVSEQEQTEGKPLRITQIDFRNDIIPTPFTIYHPSGAIWEDEDYPYTGKNTKKDIVGITYQFQSLNR